MLAILAEIQCFIANNANRDLDPQCSNEKQLKQQVPCRLLGFYRSEKTIRSTTVHNTIHKFTQTIILL